MTHRPHERAAQGSGAVLERGSLEWCRDLSRKILIHYLDDKGARMRDLMEGKGWRKLEEMSRYPRQTVLENAWRLLSLDLQDTRESGIPTPEAIQKETNIPLEDIKTLFEKSKENSKGDA